MTGEFEPGGPGAAPESASEWVTLGTGERRRLPGIGSRLAARFLDYGILSAAIFLVLLVLTLTGVIRIDENEEFAALILIIQLITWPLLLPPVVMVIYEPLLTATRGKTLGKRMVGLEVVEADRGGVPGWGRSIGRFLILAITSVLTLVSILVSDSNQGWHDRMARTVVVKSERV